MERTQEIEREKRRDLEYLIKSSAIYSKLFLAKKKARRKENS